MVDFRILGPLEVVADTVPVTLTGGKQRALLALLLLHADRVVARDRLIDDLWGEDVPETAPKMVQIFVSQLRKQLPDGVLSTRAPGYRIDLGDHLLDLHRFEQLTASGREDLARGRADEAATSLRAALDLWRGPALAEFDEPFARLEEARLAEQHLACLEERIDADLALGRHAELVAELDPLVHRYPVRERLRRQQMLALYRCGRQAEALDAFQVFRRMLDDDLGIEPSARLKELERLMLQQDASLDVARAEPRNAPRGPIAVARVVEPLAGRSEELHLLERLHEQARSGSRQIVFLSGDAGIGKTAIVDAFVERAEALPETLVAHGQCVEHRGAGEPYRPVLEALGRLTRQPAGEHFVPLLARQAPTWVVQLPWLLADEELEAVQRRMLGATPARMLREITESLEVISQEGTIVLVFEDLHWSDSSTVDLLDALARRREPARLLVLGTYRRGDAVALQHPAHRLVRELGSRGLCTEIAVGPLGFDGVRDYVTGRLGPGAVPEIAGILHQRTAGNPLFATTLLDSWLERGLLEGDRPDLSHLATDVPDTVRELIEQLLDRLDLADRELLSAASVVGREFSAAAVAAAAARAQTDVEARCDALVRSARLIERAGEEPWPDGTLAAKYRFTHDLHREVLRAGLNPGRRREMHASVGDRLETGYRSSPKEMAAEIAEHFVRADDAWRAVGWLRLAAEQALERLAHREALEHLGNGLDLLRRLPDEPDAWAEELALQSMNGLAQIAMRGWSSSEAEAALLRSRELAERLDRIDDLGWALFKLATLYEARAEYEHSEGLLKQAFVVSKPTASSGLRMDFHEVLACSLFHQGVFDDALEQAEQGLAAYDGQDINPVNAAYGDNARASCHSWAGLSLWFLGYPDLARQRARAAVSLAEAAQHRCGYATALVQAAVVEQCRLDVAATRASARAALEAATSDGYRYRAAMAMVLHGWAVAAGGEHEEGIAELERGFAMSRATGAQMDDPYYFAVLCDACTRAGRLDAAWAAVEAGLAFGPAGRRFFVESELHRLAGELLVRAGQPGEAEVRLRRALEVAREQRSPSLELRAALSLARHLDRDGQIDVARELTGGVYAGFTEGFASHDLVAARRFLS